jgi:1-acyl-sn-glycerol-3-phosphate acyltransferase
MKHILATIRLVGLAVLFTLTSLLVVVGRIFGKKGAHAMFRIGVYCKAQLLGIRSKVYGQCTYQTQLILANHPSYLDIMFFNLIKHPTTILAASNFKNWPLVGWLGKAINIIWIKRNDPNAGRQVLVEGEKRFNKGMCLMTCPEGRTSGTHDIYPVKPGLFILAQRAKVPITFMCFRYKNKAVPYFHSLKQGFISHYFKHFWQVLGQWRIPVEIYFSEPQFFSDTKEAIQAFYDFNRGHLQEILHFEVPVKEAFKGEALTRIDPSILSFRAESKEELLA